MENKLTAKELLLGENQPFDVFIQRASAEIDEVEQLLSVKLSDDLNELHDQLVNVEVYSHRLVNISVKAEEYYTLKLRACIEPKSDDISSLQQKISLNAKCYREKKLVDLLDRYIGENGLISKRISACQSIFATMRQFDRNSIDPRPKTNSNTYKDKPPF